MIYQSVVNKIDSSKKVHLHANLKHANLEHANLEYVNLPPPLKSFQTTYVFGDCLIFLKILKMSSIFSEKFIHNVWRQFSLSRCLLTVCMWKLMASFVK